MINLYDPPVKCIRRMLPQLSKPLKDMTRIQAGFTLVSCIHIYVHDQVHVSPSLCFHIS